MRLVCPQLFNAFLDIPDHVGTPVIFSLLEVPPGASPEHLAKIIRGAAVFRLGDLCELIASVHLDGDSQIIAHFLHLRSFLRRSWGNSFVSKATPF